MSPSIDRKQHNRTRAVGVGIACGLLIVGGYFALRAGRKVVGFMRTTRTASKLLDERAKALADARESGAPIAKTHLPRFPIDFAIARQIFPIDGEVQEFDPQVYFRHVANTNFQIEWPEHAGGHWIMHTNSLGIRENGKPLSTKPDLRILVAGDSHTEGVCNNDESCAHVLQLALAAAHPGKTIEAINAAKGGYTFYNYVGTLEKFLYLEPDVFIVSVYGGNDFEEVLTPYHFFEGTVRPPGSTQYWPLVQKALSICGTWLAQDGLSLKYFQEQPGEVAVALRAAEAATLDIKDMCKAHGIVLLYVYIPARFDVEDPKFYDDARHPDLPHELYSALEIRPESVKVHDHMGSELVQFLREHEIPVLDMREEFRRNAGPFYWNEDHHINVNAHRLIGQSLVPLIEGAGLSALR